MTVQEIIDRLEEVQDKSREVYGLGTRETFVINNVDEELSQFEVYLEFNPMK